MFIQVMQAKCSRPEEARAFMEKWGSDDAVGFLGGTFGVTDDGDLLGIVRFESVEAARANSERAETDAMSREFAGYLDSPIDFADYGDVSQFLDGGSESAGFVQVIRGTTSDIDAVKALMDDTGSLKEMRPEIIGGTFAIDVDGSFTQTVYFTDEASARAGEQQQPPAEVRETIEKLMASASFYDLRDPWFESVG
jgi:hypothetical protein